ncbi:MAG TPA: hypothetical protein DDX92_03490 [Flavobacteriales bacterium]|jgi:ABC-2 type transport system permease protein|nr:hypothetical protein [Flavobacteriales bacterium]
MKLLRIELVKLLRRPRTYITFGVMFIIILLINLGIYLEGETLLDFIFKPLSDQFVISGNLVNGYLLSHIILNTLWIHIPVLLSIVTANVISGEIESGVIRFYLTRPIPRWKYMINKLFVAFVFADLFMLFLGIITFIPALFLFGTGDLIVLLEGVQIIPENELIQRFTWAFLYGVLSMSMFVSVTVLLSTWLKNTLAAILASLGIFIVSTLLQTFAFGIFETWKPFLFSHHMGQWQLFFILEIPWNEIWVSATILLFLTIVISAVTIMKFEKMQINT